MAKRVPASERTRQRLRELMERKFSAESGRSELIRLAARLILEEALEAEVRDALGRDYYENGARPGSGYRNGYRTGRLRTAEGLVPYAVPQVSDRRAPFHSEIRDHVRGRTEALEDLAVEPFARGLSN